MTNEENKKSTSTNLKHLRFLKDRAWRDLENKKSELLSNLERLSKLEESKLKKTDLLNLIKVNCQYMSALSLYNYYRDEMTKLLVNKGK